MSENAKTATEILKEKLFYAPREIAKEAPASELKEADAYCEKYKAFLDAAKTEREAVGEAVRMAERNGFRPFEPGQKLSPGDRVYLNNRGKALVLAVIGSRPLSEGVSVAAAHIDSPRLDLKPNPLYEDHNLAYLDTHYYGGIKKYQWVAMPLALHGVVVKKDGAAVTVSIGEDPADPVFCVTDLLPHLADEQMKKTMKEGVKGESLDILIGSRPFLEGDDAKNQPPEMVKLNIMKILHDKYGIVETDFLSAELEAVPAGPARDVGLDRSMIGGYGHDDRVCAYPALTALMELKTPAHTAVTLLADKEEIGSDGNTGTKGAYFRYFLADLAAAAGEDTHVRHVLSNSLCLSADVNVAFDPLYPDVVEMRNCAELNRGVVLTKYTGHAGKSGSSDASAELMGRLRAMMDEAGIFWQVGELGRVDIGGGGTVAKYIAELDVDTVDLGVPVLSMHAPFEVVAKADVYMAHKAFGALLGRK